MLGQFSTKISRRLPKVAISWYKQKNDSALSGKNSRSKTSTGTCQVLRVRWGRESGGGEGGSESGPLRAVHLSHHKWSGDQPTRINKPVGYKHPIIPHGLGEGICCPLRKEDIYIYIHIHSTCISIRINIYLSICLSMYVSIYRSIFPSIYLSISIYTSISIYLSIHLSIYLSILISIYDLNFRLVGGALVPEDEHLQEGQHARPHLR